MAFLFYLFNWYPIHFASSVNEYRVLVNILRIEGTENEIYRKCDEDEIKKIFFIQHHYT